ncbi:MAG: hypothetical protein KBD78_16090 [Oligoflexales bacterium]|nr:hypothetical protein [Oligoflexales bacterium]
MKELAKIFGSEARVKILRLFLLNAEEIIDNEELGKRLRISRTKASQECKQLASIAFLKKRSYYKEVIRRGKKAKKKTDGWVLNPEFSYNNSLRGLLVEEEFLNKKELVRRFRGAGKIKLFLVSGIFIKDQEKEGRVDMLIVGDNLRKPWIDETVRKLEAEVGKELSYAIFETQEFIYRAQMYDKLVRDILDFPHEKLVSSPAILALSTATPKTA